MNVFTIIAAADPNHPLLPWLAPALIFGLLPALTSFLSGWHTMAQLYRRRGLALGGRSYFFSRICLRSTWFPLRMRYGNGTVIVHVGPEGIGLSSWLPFCLFTPPLLIPWQVMADCSCVADGWGAQRVRVQLVKPEIEISFYRGVGQQIYTDYIRYNVGEAKRMPATPGFRTRQMPGATWLRRKLHDWSGQ